MKFSLKITLYILLIFGLCLIVVRKTIGLKKKFNHNLNRLENNFFNYKYQYPINKYFFDNLECPIVQNEAMEIDSFNDDFDNYLDVHFKDFLSKTNGLVKYIPLYSKCNKKREAYLIISSGIDGKINNQISVKDTLYTDNFINHLNIYNNENYYKFPEPLRHIKHEFRLFNYFFGKKDYIIEYVNCIDMYKFQVHEIFSSNELIKQINKSMNKFGHMRRDKFGFICYNLTDTIINNKEYKMFKDEHLTILNEIYDSCYFSPDKDTIALIGTFVNYNKSTNVIAFKGCVELVLGQLPRDDYVYMESTE